MNSINLQTRFIQLQNSLRSYLRRRAPDDLQVDDVLHDVFVKALSTEKTGRQIDNMTGWLYTVARTTLADHLKARGVSTEQVDENFPDLETEDLKLHEEISRCLKPFIEELPAMYRETLFATELGGNTLSNYARNQGLSVSAIKSRVARGRAMLKEKLLSCCDIEITNGLVSDYHSRSNDCCND